MSRNRKPPPNDTGLSLTGSQIFTGRTSSSSVRTPLSIRSSTSSTLTTNKNNSSKRLTKPVKSSIALRPDTTKTKSIARKVTNDEDVVSSLFNHSSNNKLDSFRSCTTIDNSESVFSQSKTSKPNKVVFSQPSNYNSIKEKKKYSKEMAASIIQRFYRRRINSKEDLKTFFSKKKEQNWIVDQIEEGEKEKKKRRDEKAKKARQDAIKTLHKKREEAKEQNKRIANEEIKFLKESGKIIKKKEPPAKQSPSPVFFDDEIETINVADNNENNSNSNEKHEEIDNKENGFENGESSTLKSKSTFNDIMESIGELEHREEFTSKELTESRNNLSDDKLRSIMSFLDQVETTERLDDLDAKSSQFSIPLVPSSEEIEQLEQATATANELTATVLNQKIQVEDKSRRIKMLQRALDQQRELTIRHAKDVEKEMQKRLDVQKFEYEETVRRHLSFIDQLIDDKKNLTERCEKLLIDVKTKEKKYDDKMNSIVEKHNIEMKKLKEVASASEKLRRERWIDEKTKKIKEMTVKGLEPEIQKLIADHKSEIKKIKSLQEAELLEADERAAKRYVKMIEELRDQLADEKEAACSRERELARQTYEKQMKNEEEALQQQRRRLYAEIAEEKDRIMAQNSRMKMELERQQRLLEQNAITTSEATRKEYEAAREEQERRHQSEIRQLKEKLELEKESFQENLLKKQESWTLQKERELKEKARKDRDKEIELVISQLEEDNRSSRDECERVAENRIKRLRDKYDKELSQLEQSEKDINKKYIDVKKELLQIQGDNETLRVNLKQKDREITDLKNLLDSLQTEKSNFEEIVRQELADKIARTERDNKNLKNDMSELRAKHGVELDELKTEIQRIELSKENEMQEVHKRVKLAVEKKEDVVKQLKQQYEAAIKRADHLEGLLQQQRKQLLSLDKK